MINYFRKIRQHLAFENKPGKYLRYAIGEILLVVIGILIALQINNANDLRKQRTRELQYLKNIKSDLTVSINELNDYIITRTGHINSAKTILEQFYKKRNLSFSKYNQLSLPLYNWEKYYQSNNTFKELINSGNLALMSNDSIKNMLLDLELQYKKLKSEEDHYRFDAEKTFYEPQYKFVDINTLVENYMYHATNGEVGSNIDLSSEEMEELYKNVDLKNGFTLTILEYDKMNGQMEEMIKMSEYLIKIIDAEIEK